MNFLSNALNKAKSASDKFIGFLNNPETYDKTQEALNKVPVLGQIREFVGKNLTPTPEEAKKQGLVNIGSEKFPAYLDMTGAVGSLEKQGVKIAERQLAPFGKELIQTFGSKARNVLVETLNVPRVAMTTLDMSAPLRQGIIFAVGRPIKSLPAWKTMFEVVFSPKNFKALQTSIKAQPNYKIMKDAGLYIAETTGDLALREEAFMSNWIKKIPLFGKAVEASERAYTGFLNKLRVDAFNDLSASMAIKNEKFALEFAKTKKGVITAGENFKSLANFINTATGRGSLGVFEGAAKELNAVFFSPRLIASRFNMLNPYWYAKQTPLVRKEAIKTFAKFVGGTTAILGLAKLGGADVEIDPRSSDFAKIKIGDTRLDFAGGFQQWTRLYSQLLTGQRKSLAGKVSEIDAKTFPFDTRSDIVFKFFSNKLAPIPGLIKELADGQNAIGEERSVDDALVERIFPMYIKDLLDAYEEEGPEAFFTVGVPALFGAGAQTYESRSKKPIRKSIKKVNTKPTR